MTISTPPPTSHTGWDFIDRIYCITLEHRTDRRAQAQTEFEKVGLANRVEFLTSLKHPTNAELGNFTAQMNALKTGLAAGAKHILVFEDDILFDRFSPEKLQDAIDFLKSNAHWHAFFLGSFIKSSRPTHYASIINIRFRSTTHAYIVTRDFAQKLIHTPWPGRCLDDLLCSLNDDQMYALYPAIAFQSNSKTDNDKQIGIDRLRRALGGIRRLQKINEFFIVHRRTLILAHLIVIPTIIGIAAWCHFHR